MIGPRFSGFLVVEAATVTSAPDRTAISVLFDTFVFPKLPPPTNSALAKQTTRSFVLAVEPLAAPATVNAQIRGFWGALPEDGVELCIDAHGAQITRNDTRDENGDFVSDIAISLTAGASEFALGLALALTSGDAPSSDLGAVTIDSVDFAIGAAP